MDRMSRSMKRGHNPPAHTEVKKVYMEQPVKKVHTEQPRRLLNRGTVQQNTLAERAASRNIQFVDAKTADAIDVHSTNFLPKLQKPATGNAKMRGMNPFAPEKKPIQDGTSYLDRYQMKPGFNLPDVQDKTGIAARHQLQVRAVPKDIVKLDIEIDQSTQVVIMRENVEMMVSSPSELMYPASPCVMQRPPTRTNRSRPATRASGQSPMCMAGPPNMPVGEGSYIPVPPSSPRVDGGNHMPRPPAMPRGEGYGMMRDHVTYMPHPPPPRTDAWTPKSMDQPMMEGAKYMPVPPPPRTDAWTPKPMEQPVMDGAKYMPAPPSHPKKSGSERNVQSRAGAPRRTGGKKKLPPLKNADAAKKRSF